MEFFDVEMFSGLLSPEMQSSLSEKLIILAIIWFAMKNKFKKYFDGFTSHMTRMEAAMLAVADNVKELKESMESLEKNHSLRIGALEDGFLKLNDKVDSLDKPKE